MRICRFNCVAEFFRNGRVIFTLSAHGKNRKSNQCDSKLGNVVVTIAFTWSNNPVCAEAAARFVESDNGENLSPQHPPERMAPATRPGVTPIVVPIVINAMPRVALTVYAEPSESPTAAQRIVTAGRKIAGVKILSP